MATQAEVDALVQNTEEIKENLLTAKTNIEERYAELEAQINSAGAGDKVDLAPLKNAIEELGAPSQELEDLKPVAATPANDPTGGQAPTKGDGTAQENTTDPAAAQDQAQEDAARQQV